MKHIYLAILVFTLFSELTSSAQAASRKLERLIATEKEYGTSQASIGEIYYYGLEDTPRNLSEAYYWFSLCSYTLQNAPFEGVSGINKEIIEMYYLNKSDKDQNLEIFINPKAKESCDTFVNTLNKKISAQEKLQIQNRVAAWKKEHPITPPPIITPDMEKTFLLTERLWMEITPSKDMGVKNDIEGINALIKQGADLKKKKNGGKIIDQAIQYGDAEIIKALSAAGAEPSTLPTGIRNEGNQDNPKPSISTSTVIETLVNGKPEEKNQIILKIKKNAEKYSPEEIETMAAVLFRKAQDDEGLFWYIVADLRREINSKLCPQDGNPSNNYSIPKLDIVDYYKRTAPDKISKIMTQVLEWDRLNPVNDIKKPALSGSTCFSPTRQKRLRESIRDTFQKLYMPHSAPPKKNMDDLISKSELGDKEAQFDLASCYIDKRRCNAPADERQKKYDRAHQQEPAVPEIETTDEKKALPLLEKSADQNHLPALKKLAQAYIEGMTLVNPDNQKACHLILEIATHDKPSAYKIMANAPWLQQDNKSIAKYAWLMTAHKAEKPEQPFASYTLEKDMSDADLAAAQALGQQYIEKYIKQSTPVCNPDALKQ